MEVLSKVGKRRPLRRAVQPTARHDVQHRCGASCRRRQAQALLENALFQFLVVADVAIGNERVREDLPKRHAKGPHVGFLVPVVSFKHLGGGPAPRDDAFFAIHLWKYKRIVRYACQIFHRRRRLLGILMRMSC